MADEELRALERRYLATGDAALGERMAQALRRTRAALVITERALYRCETMHRGELLVGWLRFFGGGGARAHARAGLAGEPEHPSGAGVASREAGERSRTALHTDDLVLSVTTPSSVQLAQLARWFNAEHEHSSRGRWRLEGERLTFEAESEYGRVDYEGVVVGDELHLRSHSHINDHRAESIYRLILLPG